MNISPNQFAEVIALRLDTVMFFRPVQATVPGQTGQSTR